MSLSWILHQKLVGGWTTHLKNMLVKLAHLPRDRGENKTYLKPPSRIYLEPKWPIFWKIQPIHLKVIWVPGKNIIRISYTLRISWDPPRKKRTSYPTIHPTPTTNLTDNNNILVKVATWWDPTEICEFGFPILDRQNFGNCTFPQPRIRKYLSCQLLNFGWTDYWKWLQNMWFKSYISQTKKTSKHIPCEPMKNTPPLSNACPSHTNL